MEKDNDAVVQGVNVPFKIIIVALVGFLFAALGAPNAVRAQGLTCEIPSTYQKAFPNEVTLQAGYYRDLGRYYANTQRNNTAAAGCYKRAAEDNFSPYTLSGAEYALIAVEALNQNISADVRTYFPRASNAIPPYRQFTAKQFYGASVAFREVCRAENYAQDVNCQTADAYSKTSKQKGYSLTAGTTQGGGDASTSLENATIVKLISWSCQIPETYSTPPASPSALAEYYYGVGQNYAYQGNFSNAAPCYQQAAETGASPKTLSGEEYAIIAVVAMKNNVDGGRNQDIRLYVPKAEQASVPYKNFTGEQYYNTGNAFYAACSLSKDSSGNSGDAAQDVNCKQAYYYFSVAEVKGFSAASADLRVLRSAFNRNTQENDDDSLAAIACPEDMPCENNGCDVVWGVDDFSFSGVANGDNDGGYTGRRYTNDEYYGNETIISPKKYYDRALYHLKKDINASSADSATLDEAAKKRGVLCLKQASSLGYAPAQTELALMYRQGSAGNINFSNLYASDAPPNSNAITTVNYALALKFLERAVAQSYAPAYYHLALAYMNGQGVARDYRVGVSLLKVAAGYIQTPQSTANPFPLKPFQDGYDKYAPLICVPPVLKQAARCFTPYQEVCTYNSDSYVSCRYEQNAAARVCNQQATLCAPPTRGDVFNGGFLKQALPVPMTQSALYKIYQPAWQAQQALSNLYSRGTGVAKSCATSQFFWETSVRRHLAENRENNIPDDWSLRIDMIRLYTYSKITDAQGNPIKNRYTLALQDENGRGTSYNNVIETAVSTSTDGSSIGEYLDAWLPQNNRGCEQAATGASGNEIGYFDAMYWVRPAR